MALQEGGEIQVGTLSESQEAALLSTFVRRIRVTRQMLVNDDLGAFTDFASMIGRRVADLENATACALLNTANGDGSILATGNGAVLGTGVVRANKASAGSALDLVSLSAGRAAMMRQRSLDGSPLGAATVPGASGDTKTERQVSALHRVLSAMDVLAGHGSPAGSAMWFVVGLETSRREWSARQGWGGRPAPQPIAGGMLVEALGILAMHFGLTPRQRAV